MQVALQRRAGGNDDGGAPFGGILEVGDAGARDVVLGVHEHVAQGDIALHERGDDLRAHGVDDLSEGRAEDGGAIPQAGPAGGVFDEFDADGERRFEALGQGGHFAGGVLVAEETGGGFADPVGMVDTLEDGAEQREVGFVHDDHAVFADALGDGSGVVAEGEAEDDDAAVVLDVHRRGDGSRFGEGASLAGERDDAGGRREGGAGYFVGGVDKGDVAAGGGVAETFGDARAA
ncbi:hypothetical protein ABWH91_12130 [Phycisphaerales bacterium ac7]